MGIEGHGRPFPFSGEAKDKEVFTEGRRYNYIRKKLAAGTWLALASMAVSFLLTVISVLFAAGRRGEGPLFLGALGLSAILFALECLGLFLPALSRRRGNLLPTRIAALISVLLLLFWLAAVLLGLRLIG